MSTFAAFRTASRAGAARFVAGMRVSASTTSLLRPMTLNTARITGVRTFSVTPGRFGSGTTDISLSQKLQEELKYEQESIAENPETPKFLEKFLEQGVWSIEDLRGNDEVILTRKFGDENIRLMFSVADMLLEEEFEEDRENGSDESYVHPIRASLSITKSTGPGALNVDMSCQEDHFAIENISFYDDAKVGTELSAESDWKRRGLYIGPTFDTLDVALQDDFEKYLQERGINEAVATFIPEYCTYKEQQEYIKWLGKVKTFVDL